MNMINEIPMKERVFYGWFALAGVMIVIFVVGGTFVNSFGVFLPIICNEFGWSRAAVATALSLGVVAFGLPSPLFGILVSRIGPRNSLIIGNFLAALGMVCLCLVQEIWHLYLFYVIIGLGAGFGGYIPSTTVINNWFIKKRSLALGVFIACAGLGGFVFPPFVTALISNFGWRITWLILAGMIIVLGVLIGSVILVRNRPEDMAILPNGPSAGPILKMEDAEQLSVNPDKSPLVGSRHALRNLTVWLLAAFSAANAFATGTVSTHQVAYLQDIGYNPMTAATTISLMAAFHSMGSLIFGTLALRYHIRHLAGLAFVSQLIALTILVTAKDLSFVYIYSSIFGLSTGALFTALPTFIGAYFDRERYARVLGVVFPFQVIAQAVAATSAGAIFDATASYTTAFAIVILISIIGLISAFSSRPPKCSLG
jgi:MFS family permease